MRVLTTSWLLSERISWVKGCEWSITYLDKENIFSHMSLEVFTIFSKHGLPFSSVYSSICASIIPSIIWSIEGSIGMHLLNRLKTMCRRCRNLIWISEMRQFHPNHSRSLLLRSYMLSRERASDMVGARCLLLVMGLTRRLTSFR